MKLQPLSDCIIVEQHTEETESASGIILTSVAEKKFEGTIKAIGTGAIQDSGAVRAMTVKVGDVILFGEYSGQKFKFDGKEYLMMREKDVIGILNE